MGESKEAAKDAIIKTIETILSGKSANSVNGFKAGILYVVMALQENPKITADDAKKQVLGRFTPRHIDGDEKKGFEDGAGSLKIFKEHPNCDLNEVFLSICALYRK